MKIKGAIAFTRCPIGKWEREKDITPDQLSILRRLVNSVEGSKVTHEQNVGLLTCIMRYLECVKTYLLVVDALEIW